MDTFTVLERDGSAIGSNRERINSIQQGVSRLLAKPDRFPELIRRRTPRQLKCFIMRPVVLLSSHVGHRQTEIHIKTVDRPGLLALIGKTFTQLNLQVHDARVATFGEKVEDRFTITDQSGKPVSDAKTAQHIVEMLTQMLSQASRR